MVSDETEYAKSGAGPKARLPRRAKNVLDKGSTLNYISAMILERQCGT